MLLITAYVCMMRSPTILTVLPEGGDSRKQVMMVFVLAVLGCGVFTTYASGLFFRQKSRQLGVFLALGATRRQLSRMLTRELTLLTLLSCGAGALLGGPLAWGIWQVFRTFVVDTAEMALRFTPQSYWFPGGFTLFVLLVLLGMAAARFAAPTSSTSSRSPINRNPSGRCRDGTDRLGLCSSPWAES